MGKMCYVLSMPISAQSLYVQLGRMAENMPDLSDPLGSAIVQWLGRAQTLINELDSSEGLRFRNETDSLLNADLDRHQYAARVGLIFFRALTTAELRAPAASQGAFIPAGNVFDAQVEIGKLLADAKQEVWIIDPYLDEKALTDFAILGPENIPVRLLADEAAYKPTLPSASQRWVQQYAGARPLETRLSPPRKLHDRLLVIDTKDIWILTQSLNAFAARAPASIVRADQEMAVLKLAAYQDIWNTSRTI
jgi:hypothetical protein